MKYKTPRSIKFTPSNQAVGAPTEPEREIKIIVRGPSVTPKISNKCIHLPKTMEKSDEGQI